MALICLDCGAENIDGTDTCESCGQSLTMLNKPKRRPSPVGDGMLREKIEALDPKLPIAVTPDTPVESALRVMLENKIGSILVTEDDKLIGIFSEHDAVNRIGVEFEQLRSHAISEFMTALPGTLEKDNKIIFAVHKMAFGGYRHIPIVEGDRPVGVISIRDILRYTEEKIEASVN